MKAFWKMVKGKKASPLAMKLAEAAELGSNVRGERAKYAKYLEYVMVPRLVHGLMKGTEA